MDNYAHVSNIECSAVFRQRHGKHVSAATGRSTVGNGVCYSVRAKEFSGGRLKQE
jgi:hypothetical protein